MALGNKVVLPADAAEHAAIFQLIGHTCAEQGHHDCAVDKPRVQALQALELFLAIQLVDVADASHVEFETLGVSHFMQALVKTARPEEETAMDRHAVRL